MTATTALVLFHSVVSLVAIVTGFVVLAGHSRGTARPRGTAVFLVTAIATSATGLLLPPGTIGGTFEAAWIGLGVLAVMLVALIGFGARGAWRAAYLAGLAFSLFLLVFAGMAQAFLKIAPLHALAPKLEETPFIMAEAAAAALILWLTVRAFRAEREEP